MASALPAAPLSHSLDQSRASLAHIMQLLLRYGRSRQLLPPSLSRCITDLTVCSLALELAGRVLVLGLETSG